VLIAGCASNRPHPLYSWGDYQTLIYQMYVRPGEATPAEQVTQLSQNIETAQVSGLKVAPGIHAQLGYMEYLDGKPSAAAEQFSTERALYPESVTFMDRILSSMQSKGDDHDL
jgi:hypothetical protein